MALAGLKNTVTGHALSDEDNQLLSQWNFLIQLLKLIEPKTKGDQEKMGEALNELAKEDPSFRVSSDESGQT